MIAGLHGIIHTRTPESVQLDIHGVRYQCTVSLTTLTDIGQIGEEADLHVHTHVREDALTLFGFSTLEEKKTFLALIGVSGVGPKLAINILSAIPAHDLGQAVVNGDVARLTAIPGIGKKSAERLVLDLRDKLTKILSLTPQEPRESRRFAIEDELVSALSSLGYKPKPIERVVTKLASKLPLDSPVEELIRAALRELQS